MKFEAGGVVPASAVPIVVGGSCCCIHIHNSQPVEIEARVIDHAQAVHIHVTAAQSSADRRLALERAVQHEMRNLVRSGLTILRV
jgi:hypothetical protein